VTPGDAFMASAPGMPAWARDTAGAPPDMAKDGPVDARVRRLIGPHAQLVQGPAFSALLIPRASSSTHAYPSQVWGAAATRRGQS